MNKYDFVIISKTNRILRRIEGMSFSDDKLVFFVEGLLQGVRALQSFAKVQIFQYDETNTPQLISIKG